MGAPGLDIHLGTKIFIFFCERKGLLPSPPHRLQSGSKQVTVRPKCVCNTNALRSRTSPVQPSPTIYHCHLAKDFQNDRSTGTKKRILVSVPRYYTLVTEPLTRRKTVKSFCPIFWAWVDFPRADVSQGFYCSGSYHNKQNKPKTLEGLRLRRPGSPQIDRVERPIQFGKSIISRMIWDGLPELSSRGSDICKRHDLLIFASINNGHKNQWFDKIDGSLTQLT